MTPSEIVERLLLEQGIASVPADDLPGCIRCRTSDGCRVTLLLRADRLDFTGVSDWPYDNVLVCTTSDYTRTKPSAVVVVSQRLSGAIVVPKSTQEHWTGHAWLDDEGNRRPAWMVKRQFCKAWPEFVHWLKGER